MLTPSCRLERPSGWAALGRLRHGGAPRRAGRRRRAARRRPLAELLRRAGLHDAGQGVHRRGHGRALARGADDRGVHRDGDEHERLVAGARHLRQPVGHAGRRDLLHDLRRPRGRRHVPRLLQRRLRADGERVLHLPGRRRVRVELHEGLRRECPLRRRGGHVARDDAALPRVLRHRRSLRHARVRERHARRLRRLHRHARLRKREPQVRDLRPPDAALVRERQGLGRRRALERHLLLRDGRGDGHHGDAEGVFGWRVLRRRRSGLRADAGRRAARQNVAAGRGRHGLPRGRNMPNVTGSSLGRCPHVSADVWTSGHSPVDARMPSPRRARAERTRRITPSRPRSTSRARTGSSSRRRTTTGTASTGRRPRGRTTRSSARRTRGSSAPAPTTRS